MPFGSGLNIDVGSKVLYSNVGKGMEKMGVPGKRYPAIVKSFSPLTIEFTEAMPQGSKTMTFPTLAASENSLIPVRMGGKRKSRKARKGRKASRKGTYRRRR